MPCTTIRHYTRPASILLVLSHTRRDHPDLVGWLSPGCWMLSSIFRDVSTYLATFTRTLYATWSSRQMSVLKSFTHKSEYKRIFTNESLKKLCLEKYTSVRLDGSRNSSAPNLVQANRPKWNRLPAPQGWYMPWGRVYMHRNLKAHNLKSVTLCIFGLRNNVHFHCIFHWSIFKFKLE